jgi:hypothetical protein
MANKLRLEKAAETGSKRQEERFIITGTLPPLFITVL